LLHREGLRTCYVPDVRAPASGNYNSVAAAMAAHGARQNTNEVLRWPCCIAVTTPDA